MTGLVDGPWALVWVRPVLSMSFFVFFFSSRRRHTRCSRDWSSDVCSSDLPERRRAVRDLPVRPYHEEVPVVEPVLRVGGAVRLADYASGVAREQILELVVPSPRGECVGGVHADGDEHPVAAVVEQLCVLITVRMHLNRSALGSRLIEEGENDRFPFEIAEVDRTP